MRISQLATRTCRIGITGFTKAGKTALITSLGAHLMHHDPNQFNLGTFRPRVALSSRMRGESHRERPVRFGAVKVVDGAEPWKDGVDGVSDFRLPKALGELRSGRWPARTTETSKLVLEGRLSSWRGKTRFEFVDIPGERFGDCGMLTESYEEWSRQRLQELEELGGEFQTAEINAFLQLLDRDAISEEELLEAYKLAQVSRASHRHRFISPSSIMLDRDGNRLWDRHGDDLRNGRLLPVARAVCSGLEDREFAPLSRRHRNSHLFSVMAERYGAYQREIVGKTVAHAMKCEALAVLYDLPHILLSGPDVYSDAEFLLKNIAESLEPTRYLSAGLRWVTRGRLGIPAVSRVAVVANQIDRFHCSDYGYAKDLVEELAEQGLGSLRENITRKCFAVSAIQCGRSTPDDPRLAVPVDSNAGGRVQQYLRVGVHRIPETWYANGRCRWPAGWTPGEIFSGDESFFIFEKPLLPPYRNALPCHIGLDTLARFLFGVDS